MNKLKFAAIFGGGLLAGVLGTMAVQTAMGRSGAYGGEVLLLPMVLLLLYPQSSHSAQLNGMSSWARLSGSARAASYAARPCMITHTQKSIKQSSELPPLITTAAAYILDVSAKSR